MRSKKNLWVLSLLLVLSLVAAACGGGEGGDDGGDDAVQGEDGEATKGGTLTWESEEFSFVGGFDPTGEYLGDAWGVMTNLLIRNLVSYPHVGGPDGNEIVPDLAEDLPEISDDELTYTFTIKDGVKFGPPVSREITSKDVEYAFRKIATESQVAQYANYYEGVIEGLEVGKDPGPGGIAGIETPDDKTIVFTLTEPTGDFLNRLAMPAAAPQPEEVAGCFKKAGEYGRYLIASAGYMFEGSEDLDISSCKKMKPISGYDPTKFQKLVRNPDYDQETDEYRENWFDRFEHTLNTNTNDLEQKVLQGGDNDIIHTPTPATLRKFVTDEELQDQLHVDPGDRTWYITMNLLEPPFDDIHVRKAANLVMDKDGLRRAWGGETAGEIATHIVPDPLLNGLLEDYDPYPSEGHRGDVEAAKEEMKQSKYDTDGDGICDAPECTNVLQIGSNTPPNTDMLPVVEESFKKIGITLDSREVTDAYTPIQNVGKEVPLSIRPGWGKDYPDAFTFVGFLFGGKVICEGNYNYSLVGLTKENAKECGIDYPAPPPDVNDDIAACIEIPQGEERVQCWADLDKKLMEEVVPWVPYLEANAVYATSEDVTKYEFDQFTTTPAWSKLAVSAE